MTKKKIGARRYTHIDVIREIEFVFPCRDSIDEEIALSYFSRLMFVFVRRCPDGLVFRIAPKGYYPSFSRCLKTLALNDSH